MRDVVNVAVFSFNAPLPGDAQQLLGILDLIVAAFLRQVQRMGDAAAVVGMRGRAAGGEAQVVTRYNAVYIAAADAAGRFRGDAAGAHRADAAAGAFLAKLTVRRLIFDALLPSVSADLLCGFEQSVGCCFHLLDRDKGVIRFH